MNDDLRTALIHIRLLLCGAIEMMERHGPAICEKLEEAECDALTCAMDSIREGLYGACGKTESVLIHQIGEAAYAASLVKNVL